MYISSNPDKELSEIEQTNKQTNKQTDLPVFQVLAAP